MAEYVRGDVVKGTDLLADHDYRPYVCLSDETHPFSDEEALSAAATTTRRNEHAKRGPRYDTKPTNSV